MVMTNAVMNRALARGLPTAVLALLLVAPASADGARQKASGDDVPVKVSAAQRDREMLARLEEIRLAKSAAKSGHFDLEGAARAYAAAFRHYGIDVLALKPDEAADRIRARKIALPLALALDDWAMSVAAPERRRLLAVARAADADPNRVRLREALARADRAALVTMARDVNLNQPAVTLSLLAQALVRSGDLADAVALLRQAHRRYPADFSLNHDLASVLVREQPPHWTDAVRFYTAAVALRPENAAARMNLGVALLGKGDLDEAQASLREAIRLKPDLPEAHLNLGRVLMATGHAREAVAAYRRALALKPDSAEGYLLLGLALRSTGQLNEAIAACRRAIALDPLLAAAYYNLGLLLADAGRLDEANAALRNTIRIQPTFPRAHTQLGIVLHRRGKRREALAAFRKALTSDRPDDVTPHLGLGKVLLEEKEYRQAADHFRQALALKPDLPGPYLEGARASARAGLHRQALTWLRAGLARHIERIERDGAKARVQLQAMLRRWQTEPDLASVRHPAELAALPAEDQQTARKLWADVAAILRSGGAR
jgi:tetratricopeptide (TPR) repeat protein